MARKQKKCLSFPEIIYTANITPSNQNIANSYTSYNFNNKRGEGWAVYNVLRYP